MKKYYYASRAIYAYGFASKAARDEWAETTPDARKINYERARMFTPNPRTTLEEAMAMDGYSHAGPYVL